MKKKILFAMSFVMMMAFASCGDDDDPVEPQPQPEPDPVQPIDDGSKTGNETDSTNTGRETDTTNIGGNTDTTKIDDEIITPKGNMSIYLCFGQSNMEGNAAVEAIDKQGVPGNFLNMIVAKDDASHYKQDRYTWRQAVPPLARFTTGLTPADYFGRKMLEYMSPEDTIGIVMVAIGGASIEAFEKEKCITYCNKSDHADWYKNYLAQYDKNPYGVLIKAAKEAQKYGVIKGILLHQGETNNTDPKWPNTVKQIYNDIIADLHLDPEQVPLLAGEMLRQDQGGICWGHNSVIAKLPNVIPNAHVISSEGCKGNGVDGFHFCAAAYRTLGRRYAYKMLDLMGISYEVEEEAEPAPIEDVDSDPAGVVAKEDAFDFSKFSPNIYAEGSFDADTKTFTTGQYGFAGWNYEGGADFSGAKYLVVELDPDSEAIGSYEFSFRLYHKDSYWTEPAIFQFGNSNTVKIELDKMRDKDGHNVFPTHIYYAGFWTIGGVKATIKDIRFED